MEWLHEPAIKNPVDAARNWKIPTIESADALAEWLQVSPSEPAWFADLERPAAKLGPDKIEGALRHYHYRIVGRGRNHSAPSRTALDADLIPDAAVESDRS